MKKSNKKNLVLKKISQSNLVTVVLSLLLSSNFLLQAQGTINNIGTTAQDWHVNASRSNNRSNIFLYGDNNNQSKDSWIQNQGNGNIAFLVPGSTLGSFGLGMRIDKNKFEVWKDAEFQNFTRFLDEVHILENTAIGNVLANHKFQVEDVGNQMHFRSDAGAPGSGQQLEIVAWANGFNIENTKVGGNLYVNRNASESSNLFLGRANKDLIVNGSTGNVGIGTDEDPKRKLHLFGDRALVRMDRTDGKRTGFLLVDRSDTNLAVKKTWFVAGSNTGFIISDEGTSVNGGTTNPRFFIDRQGKTAIGSMNTIDGTTLHVDGRVYISEKGGTEEGFDDLNNVNHDNFLLWVEEGIVSKDFALAELTDWPDYVFDENYQLKSLYQTESFIKQNGHLHTMPSAQTIEEKGFTVGDMTKRMLKTIEELTLHTIEQEKQIDAQKILLNEQNDTVNALMERLEKLERQKEKK